MLKHAFFIVFGIIAIYLTGGFMVLEFNVVEWTIAGRTIFISLCWFYVFSYVQYVLNFGSAYRGNNGTR